MHKSEGKVNMKNNSTDYKNSTFIEKRYLTCPDNFPFLKNIEGAHKCHINQQSGPQCEK